MRWMGIIAALCTLTAVILNTIWFGRYGRMSASTFLALSAPTVLYLGVFLAGAFAIAWLSGRLLARLDFRDGEGERGAARGGQGGGGEEERKEG